MGQNFITSIIITDDSPYSKDMQPFFLMAMDPKSHIDNDTVIRCLAQQDNFLNLTYLLIHVGPKISLANGSDPYYLVHNFNINVTNGSLQTIN